MPFTCSIVYVVLFLHLVLINYEVYDSVLTVVVTAKTSRINLVDLVDVVISRLAAHCKHSEAAILLSCTCPDKQISSAGKDEVVGCAFISNFGCGSMWRRRDRI